LGVVILLSFLDRNAQRPSFIQKTRTSIKDMDAIMKLLLLCLWLLFIVCFTLHAIDESNRPVSHAHAHNDYLHERPLLDALDNGFTSVEADVFLVEGELLIGHDYSQLKPGRTLKALYLEPLANRVHANNGSVQKGADIFHLLIDFKTEGESTYIQLKKELEPYHHILTEFTKSSTEHKAITIIVSGNRPRSVMLDEDRRWAGFDGRISDLETKPDPHFMPWISDNWRSHFRWNGNGPIPESEWSKLESFVQQVHTNGQMIRFWAAPDTSTSWIIQSKAGVDFINTDRLEELSEFLMKQTNP